MPNKLDLTGNVYGELTVIEMLYHYEGKRRTYCRCMTICDDVKNEILNILSPVTITV